MYIISVHSKYIIVYIDLYYISVLVCKHMAFCSIVFYNVDSWTLVVIATFSCSSKDLEMFFCFFSLLVRSGNSCVSPSNAFNKMFCFASRFTNKAWNPLAGCRPGIGVQKFNLYILRGKQTEWIALEQANVFSARQFSALALFVCNNLKLIY